MRDGAGAGTALAIGQGTFYLASGIWPLVHEPSFEAVTGPKRERWLVRTVGVLVAATGALALAGARRAVTAELAVLGAACAAGLASIDLWYAGVRRRIAPVYLADAAAEVAIAGAWGIVAARRRAARRHPGREARQEEVR